MAAQTEVFGTEDQQAVLRRGRALRDLLCTDPRYSYYGRTVGLVTPEDGGLDDLAALARVQGNSNYGAIPKTAIAATVAGLEARGLTPLVYDRWEGGRASLEAARALVAAHPIPEGLTVVALDADTPVACLASMAEMALTCGVLPTCGDALRGRLQPSVCLVAVGASGEVVSCAASAAFTHPGAKSFAGEAWWGMLATHPDRRGERLALILGAQVLLAMAAKFGFGAFFTGVEPGNTASEAVCARMGFENGPRAIIGCADPAALKSGRMTK